MEPSEAPTSEQIEEAIANLAADLADIHADTENLCIVGIANGGVPLAKSLQTKLVGKLGREIPYGTADISFHRDDIGRNPIPKETEVTHILSDVEGATILLVDVVLFTGRSVRKPPSMKFSTSAVPTAWNWSSSTTGAAESSPSSRTIALSTMNIPGSPVEVTLDPDNPSNHAIEISDPA